MSDGIQYTPIRIAPFTEDTDFQFPVKANFQQLLWLWKVVYRNLNKLARLAM